MHGIWLVVILQKKQLEVYPYFQCFSRIFYIGRLSLMFAYLHTYVGASNLRFRIVSLFISLIP